ncbi:hypothetical protein SKAU_G00404540 [Synaphobranchus kaupii]|uniref:Uncharacterized protein n=1 Tax=Synaphobranchus kaupii TaxID=118154 RepID=A0A9Q1IBW4_SYNKA|nr:hypothetical protein SKAU_G00404540 [Synaphobranchus kaupii]
MDALLSTAGRLIGGNQQEGCEAHGLACIPWGLYPTALSHCCPADVGIYTSSSRLHPGAAEGKAELGGAGGLERGRLRVPPALTLMLREDGAALTAAGECVRVPSFHSSQRGCAAVHLGLVNLSQVPGLKKRSA